VISPIINDNSAAPVVDSYGSVVSPLIIQDNSIGAPASVSYSGSVSPVVIQASSSVSASDSYGAALSPVLNEASYSAPASAIAPVITQASASPAVIQASSPVSSSDSYGAALSPVINQVSDPAPSSDSYGGAIAPVIVQASKPVSVTDSFGGAIVEASNSAPESDSYGGALSPVITATDEAAPASNTFVENIGTVNIQSTADANPSPQISVVLPQAEQDSYGSPQSNVLAPQESYDDYDPDDVPADQAAPLAGYGNSDSLDTDGSTESLGDDYDPNDVPQDQASATPSATPVPDYVNSDTVDSYGQSQSQPIISDNTEERSQQTFDVYGSALAPVGTSAPVPDEIFTVDSKAPTSFDSYNPQSIDNSLSQSFINDNGQDDVIDLTEPQADVPQFAPAIEQLPDLTVNDIDISSENVTPVSIQEVANDVVEDVELASYDEDTPTASLLPPVIADVVDTKINELFSDDAEEPVTPTAAPVLFTYAPVEGRFVNLTKRLSKLNNKKLYHKLLIQSFFSEAKQFTLF